MIEGNECVSPRCPAPLVYSPVRGACVCLPGRKCVCPPPLVAGPIAGECVWPPQTKPCLPATGSLSVTKVVAPDPDHIGGTLIFPMTVTCTNPTYSYPLNVQGNTSTAPTNLPIGSHCTVTEGTLPSLPPGCHWLAPVYSPASVTIAGGLNQETVTNGYRCEIMTGSLIVTKEVVYVGPIVLPSQIYPVTVTCGSTVTNLNLVPGVPQTVSNIPLNTSCSVVEGTVPTPGNVCPPRTTPSWTTVYVPPSPITITGTGLTELVTNTLTCSPVQAKVCPPPQVANVDGICVCPPPIVTARPPVHACARTVWSSWAGSASRRSSAIRR